MFQCTDTQVKMVVLQRIFGPRRFTRNLEVLSLLITATLCLLVILQIDLEGKKSQTIRQDKVLRKQKPEPETWPDMFLNSVPKCTLNSSASEIHDFSTLPKNIQDFLFYQHCRHFPMLLNNPGKCGGPKNSADVFLLLVIKSSPPNYDRREVLRKTWALERLHSGVWIRTVFISGTTGDGYEKEKLNKLLELENREYQDILQWDFDDTFYNLTLKQVLFLEWMERFCPDVHFLLNGDDDIFANTDNMVQYLKGLDDNDGSKHLFIGHLIQHVGPIRHPGSKYYIPVQIHKSDTYPPYCGGGGFLLSQFTSRVIYNMSHSIPLLPIDDVYMGMCLEKAGLLPRHHIGVRTAGLGYVPSGQHEAYNPCYYREVLLVHRFLPLQIYIMWHEIHREDLNCTKRTKGNENSGLFML
ncbi:N-acetyllactosaminide beta-1,3-N-acetylglucosaminyltransferase 3-like isoform X1 [Tachysurus fulvidraco]|uniref:N-acetyllactosaminide beta-1,3-N-acetylglucosaminyltransferase 3-like isoform X1 n=3 Tax=Tachysurus fulvidraco TaxID=1234273 RepID=UPI001FEDFFF3|nr:N-acetyllactosaminide beta-1,3-N-acetylglucosaminyltransferase 3-like isoform X1 [Tachysurus fulvidraco]